MNEKINHWIKEVKLISEIAKIEPQCALSCFISGYKHKLNYYMRTVPNISNLLRHIDDVITKEFIPAITLYSPKFPFDPPENIRKPKVF